MQDIQDRLPGAPGLDLRPGRPREAEQLRNSVRAGGGVADVNLWLDAGLGFVALA